MSTHQYVESFRNATANEELLADHVIRFLYSRRREEPGFLLNALGSGMVTDALAHWQFDRRLRDPKRTIESVAHRMMIRETETVAGFAQMQTLRDLFERPIRYWDLRPLPEQSQTIVSPADGKLLPFAAFARESLPIKSKFIRIDELLGGRNPWSRDRSHAAQDRRFSAAAIAPLSGVIVRLTPDVYHYTHAPVAGRVLRHELIDGKFHSCNPAALTHFPGSYAFNRRAITVYDSDVPGGSGVGVVVQIDVAAMMIGQIESRFSVHRYEAPQALAAGDFVPRGSPVSLFRPGSSTSVVLWDGRRAEIGRQLVANSRRHDLQSRFSDWLGQPWVETQVAVRQSISENAAS
jgi:phosphatidylserine decarboxylase